MKYKTELIKNTAIIGLGKLSTQIVTFLLLPLYTTLLSTNEYGDYDFLIVLATFILPVIRLNMEESMFRFLIDAKNEKEKQKIIGQTLFFIIISLLIFLIISIILFQFIYYKYAYYLIFYVITSALNVTLLAILRGNGKIKQYSLISFITSFITIILNVLFILVIRTGVKGLMLSNIIAFVIAILILIVILYKNKYLKVSKPSRDNLRDMLKYSIPLIPNSIAYNIINLSDRLVIMAIMGASSNGIYSVSNKFPSVINTLYSFFYVAWKESASKIIKDENNNSYYNSIYIQLNRFLIGVSILLIAILPFVFNILINSSYNDAYLYIPILVIAMYFSNLSGYYGGIFAALKKTKIMGITTIIGAIINLFVNVLCIKYVGLYAAAIANLISCFVMYILRKNKLKKFVIIKPDKTFLASIIICLIVLLCYYINNIYIQIISFLVALIYVIYINKNIVNTIIKKTFKRR